MNKLVQFTREKVLTPRNLKWTAGALIVIVPGVVAAVNLPKLWRKQPGATAAVDGSGDSTDRDRSAAESAKDPFSSGRFSKRFDRTAKAVPRQYEDTNFDDDPYSSLPDNEPTKKAAQRPARNVVRTGFDEPAKKAAVRASDVDQDPLTGDIDPLADEPDLLDSDPGDSVVAPIDSSASLDPAHLDDSVDSTDPFGGESAPVDAPAAPNRGQVVTAGNGKGRPGDEKLDGAQKPTVTIEKFAPDEVQIGKEALFEIAVRNEGKVPAHDVQVLEDIPSGTQLVNTEPATQSNREGQLVWSLGTLAPGEERLLQFRVLPVEEGELGSVAKVLFSAHASVRTTCTRPKLLLDVEAPKQVLIGEKLTVSIHASNPGTGAATALLLEAAVPDALEHQAGPELEYDLGSLKPNQTRDLDLSLKAVRPGRALLTVSAQGDANLKAQQRIEVEVLAPALAVSLNGSKKRYLEREATFVLTVSNPGTAPAKNIELATYLPSGMKFVKADNYGEYDAKTRSVHWSLEELPAGETGEVTLNVMPTAAGEQRLLVEGAAARGLGDKQEYPIAIEGVAAILFEVVDVTDPIDVGAETTYEIRVVNQGSKAATDVRIVVKLPDGLKPVDAEAPVEHAVEGNQVVFDALPQLAPKADTTYHVRVKALSPGDRRVSVQLLTNEMRTPVTKEESTHVLSDE